MCGVRIAKAEDKKEFYRLWKVCFGDSDAFCDWFFEHRYIPSYSVVLENQNKIVSCMQAFPYSIRIRGKDIPGAMLCGVSTHPDHRGRGYMSRIFSFEMNHLKEIGCVVTPHTPAVLHSYFPFGHYPVADANYLEFESAPVIEQKINLKTIKGEEINQIYPLYMDFCKKYSGIIARTKDNFARKAADYASDGGKCAVFICNSQIMGYAFYYQTNELLACVEIVAEDGYYHYLIKGLLAQAEGLKCSFKLPANLYVQVDSSKLVKKQKGVMGLCNLSALLEALNLDIPYSVKINDHIVTENNGIFDFNGKESTAAPVFEISAGRLLQVLVGYRTLNDIKDEINIFDAETFSVINESLPAQKCYIIDEY